eukprot:10791496-Alexandrium_andersonii.AAC.1
MPFKRLRSSDSLSSHVDVADTASRSHKYHGDRRGPETALGLTTVGSDMLGRLVATRVGTVGPPFVEELRSSLAARPVLTTSYSGVGTMEAAMAQVVEAASDREFDGTGVTLYSASEINPTCRSILLAHGPSSKPLHVFGNILDRVPKPELGEILRIEKEKI